MSAFLATDEELQDLPGEVVGTFLLGLAEAFHTLNLLPEGYVRVDRIDPDQWYPYSMLMQTLRAIERSVPASPPLLFRAGMSFLRAWYEQGPGRDMMHSGLDWLQLHDESGGFNSVVRGGSADEIGWSILQSLDLEQGVAVYEQVSPFAPEFIRGIYYCGCTIFDDVDCYDSSVTTEPFSGNPLFHRILVTLRFRHGKPGRSASPRRLEARRPEDCGPLDQEKVADIVSRHRALAYRQQLDTEYNAAIQNLLANALGKSQDLATELGSARDEAQAANRAKSAFLASMSHELRTPLNGILALSSLLEEAMLTGQQREWLTALQSSGQMLLSIINDILDLSKIEAGRMTIDKVPFILQPELEAILRPLSLKAEETEVNLEVTVDADVPPAVLGDPLRLRQILTNLLGNALKFTERGSVTLEVSRVPPGSDQRGPGLCFRVRDTGIGIEGEVLNKLFRPFVQANNSITGRFGGTGLGLSISRSLAERMGGRIWAESHIGQGSTFTAVLPFPETEPPKQRRLRSSAGNGPAEICNVLVVDDNEVNLMVASAHLSRRGHQVEMASDGAEALAKLDDRRYHIVLMDVHMPVMSGLEATERLRELEKTRNLPRQRVVAMTASILPDECATCLAAGMDDVIGKPFNPQELFALVELEANGN